MNNNGIQGSLSVSQGTTIGGNLAVRGTSTFDHNVKIKGWIDAKNIKGPLKGLFESEDALKLAYPEPQPGWFALVGNTLPAEVYRVENGEWADTGHQGGEIFLSLDSIEEDINKAQSDILELQETISEDVLAKVNLTDLDFDLSMIGKIITGSNSCKFVVMWNRKNIGILHCFSDNSQHMLTQVFTTHCIAPFSGGSPTHSDDKIYQYFRSYHLSRGGTSQIPTGTWGEWKLVFSSDINTEMVKLGEEDSSSVPVAPEVTADYANKSLKNWDGNDLRKAMYMSGVLDYEEFSTSKEYAVGKVVSYMNKAYKFIAPHSAGAWDESQVEETSLKEEVESNTKLLSKNVSTISRYNNIVFTTNEDKSVDINITDSNSNYFSALSGMLRALPKSNGSVNVPNSKALFLNEKTDTYYIGSIGTTSSDVLIAFIVNGNVALGLLKDAYLNKQLEGKQDTLISGVNIKTINGVPILGVGDIPIEGGGSVSDEELKILKYDIGIVATYTNIIFESKDDNSLDINVTTSTTNIFYINGGGLKALPTTNGVINVPNSKGLYLNLDTNTYEVKGVGVTYTNDILIAYVYKGCVENGLLRGAFLYNTLQNKQEKLVSGTDIKTINGQSLLGSGDIEIQANSQNSYKDKKVLILGDSITANQNCFSKKLLELIQPSVGYRRGVYGSAIADNSTSTPSFCQRVDLETDDTDNISAGLPSAVDLVIMFGGVNDWGTLRSQEMGSIEEGNNRNTFYGGLHYVLSVLRSKYPSAKIAVMNLHHIYQKDSNFKEITYNTDYDITKGFTYAKNNTEKTFSDYRQAIKSVAELYGCQVIDLFNAGFSYLIESDSTKYSIDGLHPNEEGGNKIAEYVYSQITY